MNSELTTILDQMWRIGKRYCHLSHRAALTSIRSDLHTLLDVLIQNGTLTNGILLPLDTDAYPIHIELSVALSKQKSKKEAINNLLLQVYPGASYIYVLAVDGNGSHMLNDPTQITPSGLPIVDPDDAWDKAMGGI